LLLITFLLLKDYYYLTGFSIAHHWQKKRGEIPPNTRLLPKIPFVCGGKFEIENLYLLDSIAGTKFRGDFARNIQNIPNGATIDLRFVE
jgi:hypothetical protein